METTGEDGLLPSLAANSNSETKVLALGMAYLNYFANGAEAHSKDTKVYYSPMAFRQVSWREAIRLARSGGVNLNDHTRDMYPLEHYQLAWQELEKGAGLNILLVGSKELELA